jgi:hypothetical protein
VLAIDAPRAFDASNASTIMQLKHARPEKEQCASGIRMTYYAGADKRSASATKRNLFIEKLRIGFSNLLHRFHHFDIVV